MVKLAPILEEVPEDIGMSGHEGSGGHDRKLHQALPFHVGGGIGPESITRKSEMANHNSRVHKRDRMEEGRDIQEGQSTLKDVITISPDVVCHDLDGEAVLFNLALGVKPKEID